MCHDTVMRVRVEIDDQLLDEALALTGARTKREVIELALEELVKTRRKKNLADLAGRIRFTARFDHKTTRKLRG